MNTNHNSTRSAGSATITCLVPADDVRHLSHSIDCRGGLSEKANSLKHLSEILLGQIEAKFGSNRGELSDSGKFRTYEIHLDSLATLEWLSAEVWSVAKNLDDLVAQLDVDITPISDIAYEATKAAGK